MGRAIVREPDAFLMDEPLSNLDAKLRVEMRVYLARAAPASCGTTTLYVTHDQTEAMTMGDRVAVMRDGRLEQVDTPQRALRAPGQPLRRRLHRLAGDELPALAADERERRGLHQGRRDESPPPRPPRRTAADLGDYVGPELIVGIRPEDIEDAAFVPSANGSAFDVEVSLAEPMGAEVIAHFPLDADPILASETMVAARGGEESEDAGHLLQLAAGSDSGQVVLTARLNTRTRAQTGEPLRVAVDVERLHFFDPATEEAIW